MAHHCSTLSQIIIQAQVREKKAISSMEMMKCGSAHVQHAFELSVHVQHTFTASAHAGCHLQ